ncbi:tetratricopeptide repeat protein [Thermocoleostomius sinensis]|uniref:Tetratricopeptide repeat protein n=1 Tax=Thermocoleostomius sinensis A174 TaxID=2016057 RepID=A0A9E8Z8S4_9CYAN|nr:tetratricopeptide repeat protein [Thermocoleostomius sinensis]WAL58599.1 tetratricopeptide repeat protein [Thermocoleostomius sinensis A174]
MLKHLKLYLSRTPNQSNDPNQLAVAESDHDGQLQDEAMATSVASRTTAKTQLQLGHDCFQHRQFNAAIDHYRAAVAADPTWIDPYSYLADALNQAGNSAEAAIYYRQAIELTHQQANSSNCFSTLNSDKLSNSSREQISELKKSVSASSPSHREQLVEDHWIQAKYAYEQRQWHETIACCQAVLNLQATAPAYNLLGNALQQLYRLSEARSAYMAAIELAPSSADGYANLGSLYAQQQQWQTAADHYQQAIELNPNFAGAYRNLAKVWAALNQATKATECWHRALLLEPEKIPAEEHLNFGNWLLQRNRIAEAIVCYHQAMQLSPMLVKAFSNSVSFDLPYVTGETDGGSLTVTTDFAPVVTAAFLEDVEAYLHQEQWDQAIAVSTEALKQLEPEIAQTYRCLANAFYAKEDLDTAIRYYQRVVELESESAADHINLGSLYAQQQQWQVALSCYEQAIALDPNLASAHWNLGRVWERLEQPEPAADAFFRAITLEPSWASLEEHLVLCQTLRSQGKETAIACYQQVLQRDDTCAVAQVALADLLAQRGQWQQAITHYRRAIQSEPNNVSYLVGLGQALAELQQGRLAIAVYRQVVALDPQPSYYLTLALWLEQQGRWQEAIACYQTLSNLQPDDWQIHHKLGDLWNQQQDWQQATFAFQRAIALNPNCSWSHHNLGDALFRLQQWQSAAAAYRQAIVLNPDFHGSHYNLAEALTSLQDWDEAITAYRRAAQLQPTIAELPQKLGNALWQRAKADTAMAFEYFQQAIQQQPEDLSNYHKVIEIQPNCADLYVQLADALVRNGRLEGAIVFYQMAQQLTPNDAEIIQKLDSALSQSTIDLHGFEDKAIQSQAEFVDFYANSPARTLTIEQLVVGEETPSNQGSGRLGNPEQLYSVDVVICVHNALEDVKRCLASVLRHNTVNHQVIIVDDGSSLETEQFLATWVKQHPRSQLFRNPTALGYTKAANIGLSASQGDYVVLLNSDTIVTPGWINKLLDCANSDEAIGIVGPLSNCASWQSVPELQDSNGAWKNNTLPLGYSLDEWSQLIEVLSDRSFPQVSFINGFCYLIKRKVIAAIGLLDDLHFPEGYGEENDFSLRAQAAGFKLAIADQAYVYHAKSKSFGVERRRILCQQGAIALKQKYEHVNISALTKAMQHNRSLNSLRLKLSKYY